MAEKANSISNADLAVFPPSVYIDAVGTAIRGSSSAGAQNLYPEAPGAFTGEICSSMLVDLGCRYVILGHSERRHILRETDADINKKVHAALAAKLVPSCALANCLPTRSWPNPGGHQSPVRELASGSFGQQFASVVIAYEPVWAIGTGKWLRPNRPKRCIRTFAKSSNAATMPRLHRRFGSSTAAASSPAMLRSCSA